MNVSGIHSCEPCVWSLQLWLPTLQVFTQEGVTLDQANVRSLPVSSRFVLTPDCQKRALV